MIQDSINQMLSVAGMAGGYLGHMKSEHLKDVAKTQADDIIEAKADGSYQQAIAGGANPKVKVGNPLTTPVGARKVQKEMFDKANNTGISFKESPEEEAIATAQMQETQKVEAQEAQTTMSPQALAAEKGRENMLNMIQQYAQQANDYSKFIEKISNSPRHGKGQFIRNVRTEAKDILNKENKK